MAIVVSLLLALAGGVFGGLFLWHAVGIVGTLAAAHPDGALAAPLVLLAWKVGVTVPFGPEMTVPWPGRPGFRCLGLSLAMAAPVLVALLVMRRRSDPVHPGIAGAALGMTAAVAAGAFVDLWCPVAYLPHVLLGHILPLALGAAFGAWAGRRLLPP